jgi:hypothetical protein
VRLVAQLGPLLTLLGVATGQEDTLGELGRNLRVTLDLAVRGVWDRNAHELGSIEFAGIDLHKVFTGDTGDIGTLIFQPYGLRLDNVAQRPDFIEDDHDWDLEWRICTFNYTALAHGKFNLKVGHIELPYGLEHAIDTNGTIHDFQHQSNLGVKSDWGAGVNGTTESLDYEVTLTRGSGNEWHQSDDPFALTGRVSTPREEQLVVGFSWFHAELQGPPGSIVRRTRVGADAQLASGPIRTLFELSAGRDFDTDVYNALTEINWTTNEEDWFAYLQTLSTWQRNVAGDLDVTSRLKLGVAWSPHPLWSLSAELAQDLKLPAARENTTVAAQVRFRR